MLAGELMPFLVSLKENQVSISDLSLIVETEQRIGYTLQDNSYYSELMGNETASVYSVVYRQRA